jgi:hypothetical protein
MDELGNTPGVRGNPGWKRCVVGGSSTTVGRPQGHLSGPGNCFNAQATRSFAPIYLMKTKLVLAGKSKPEIAHAIATVLDKKNLPALEPGGASDDGGGSWVAIRTCAT